MTAGNFSISKTALEGVLVLSVRQFNDTRGVFTELYHQPNVSALGITDIFVQTNLSVSHQHVLRGLHYQEAPYAMSKLVCCVKGRVFDVAVDIRPGSATFGQWVGEMLTPENGRMLYLPRGFAHGFCAMEEGSMVLYQCDNVYEPSADKGVLWNDPVIGIDWPVSTPLVSLKDENLPLLSAVTTGVL